MVIRRPLAAAVAGACLLSGMAGLSPLSAWGAGGATPEKRARPEKRRPVTVKERLEEVGPRARKRLKPWFERQELEYPPARVSLVAFKDQRLLKLFAADAKGPWKFIGQYPIAAASGVPGPKLREGDFQVPEGIYRVSYLNPESLFHLSLGLNYPNDFDRRQARRDGRKKLGGDIMVHGSWYSEGCLALGDTAAEDLFVLAADTGLQKVRVVIAPVDFRNGELPDDVVTSATHPAWTQELYAELRRELRDYEDGFSTESQVIRYADASKPRPPAPKDPVLVLLDLLADALEKYPETSATLASDGETSAPLEAGEDGVGEL